LIGLYFVFALSLPYLLILGIIGVASSLFYVGPPFKLAYRGIGELVLGLNFGPVMTLGAFYVQTGRFMLEPFLASIPVGLLIAAVVWINEFPDMEADKAVGKKNLVLRLGYTRSIRVYVGMIIASYGLIIIYALLQLTTLASLIALLSVPFALKAVKILRTNYRDPHGIIPANANTILLHLAFGVLAIFGFLIGAFVSI
jgi:1,4-dihydroxy-2-naphthoate octaprenyltransferase